ncbi:MAG: DUF167 family protein [Sinimarinibacterium sp.]|jgi:hypothetical protein
MRRSTRAAPGGGRKDSDIGCFYAWEGDTLILNILGKPSAGRDAIGKVSGHQLNVSVTEAPMRGRATDHMVRFLAGRFGVAVSDIEVVFGRFNVNKQLRIRSPQKLPSVIGKQLSQQAPDSSNSPRPRARRRSSSSIG